MTVYVVDRSNNNPPADAELDDMVAGGVRGLILKASEGTGFVDQTFADRARAAHARGLTVGAYHFLLPWQDPRAQAALFNSMCDRAGVPLPIRCCDAETNGGNVETATQSFCPLAAINLLYSGAYFAQSELAAPIAGVDWWIASYGAGQRPRAPWGTEAGWQFTDASRWGDLSIFDDATWAQLTGGAASEGDDMPQPTDWAFHLDIGGGHYYHFRPDGSGAASPRAPFVNYSALGSDGGIYQYGPGRNGGVFDYPHLPAADRQGDRRFYSFWLG